MPPPVGHDGEVHKMTSHGPHDVHIDGCSIDAMAAGLPSHDLAAAYVAKSSFRLEREDAPWANNTTVAKRVAFTFPDTTASYEVPNPHTIIIDRDGTPVKVRVPLNPSSTMTVQGDLDQGDATLRFYANGTGQELGTIVVAPVGGGYEVSAVYATGTELRGMVYTDIVVNTQLIPVWNANLVGMHGSFPMREYLLSKDGQTAFTIAALQGDAGALGDYAASWACIAGASLFDTAVDPAPVPTGVQKSIITAEPTPQATKACTDAGLAGPRLDRCTFDYVISGEEAGPVMAAIAGSWSTVQDRPAPLPVPTPCGVSDFAIRAASIDGTSSSKNFLELQPIDKIICRRIEDFLSFKQTAVDSQQRFQLNSASIGKGNNRVKLYQAPVSKSKFIRL